MMSIRSNQIQYSEVTLDFIFKNTHIPIFQRVEDEEHTKTIYEKLKSHYDTYGEILLFGLISLAKIPECDKYLAFDGQHRLGALRKLKEEFEGKDRNIIGTKIRIDFYNLKSEEEALYVYNIINSNKKTDIFKGNIEPYVLPSIQRYFKEMWSSFCKSSKKPRAPNINLDIMIKHLQGHDIINKLNIKNSQQLQDKIRKLNEFYSCQPNEKFKEWGIKDIVNLRKLCEPASSNKFYLGLFRHYEWVNRLLEGEDHSSQDHRIIDCIIKEERKSIPKSVRREVWDKDFEGLMKGQCYCCERELDFERDYECGHIVAAKHGGPNVVENLRVVCKTCNLDMNTMNMNEYKKLFIN